MSVIDRSFTKVVSATVTNDVRWIQAETEPEAPTGYARLSELDLDFGILGKFWAFLKTS